MKLFFHLIQLVLFGYFKLLVFFPKLRLLQNKALLKYEKVHYCTKNSERSRCISENIYIIIYLFLFLANPKIQTQLKILFRFTEHQNSTARKESEIYQNKCKRSLQDSQGNTIKINDGICMNLTKSYLYEKCSCYMIQKCTLLQKYKLGM